MTDRLDELFHLACSNGLSDAEAAELDAHLAESKELQSQYVKYCQLHCDLLFRVASEKSFDTFATTIASQLPNGSQAPPVKATPFYAVFLRPVPMSLAVSTLVIGIVVVFLGFWERGEWEPDAAPGVAERESKEVFVAELQAEFNTNWIGGPDIQLGSQFKEGQWLNLKRGVAELKLGDGTVVVVEGPALICTEGQDLCALKFGKIFARVPETATNFRIITDDCTIIDLGTEFGVDCRNGKTNVYVQKGRVKVVRNETAVEIGAGKSLSASDLGLANLEENPRFTSDVPTATSITWETVQDFHGIQDLLTSGNAVAAVNCGPRPVNVGGLAFAAGRPFNATFPTPFGLSGQSTGDASLDELLGFSTFHNQQEATIRLAGLEVGKRYQLQLLYCDGRAASANRPMIVSDGIGNSVALTNNVISSPNPPFGQYVVGTFAPTTSTVPIVISAQDPKVNAHLTAYVLREVTPD